jgi:hypothetical protein
MRRALKASTADGAHAEASFVAPGGGATIDEVVHVLPDTSRARALVKAYTARSSATCFQHALGVPVTVDPAKAVGTGATTLRAATNRPLVIQVARAGRVVTAVAYANAVTPPPDDAINRITKSAVERAAAALVAGRTR